MTYAQVLTQVKGMSHEEKLILMKVLADTLVHDLPLSTRKRTLKHLYGALRPKTGRLPSNKELRREYQNHLIEKHK